MSSYDVNGRLVLGFEDDLNQLEEKEIGLREAIAEKER